MNNISVARARKQTMFDFLPLRQECEADRLKRANARSLFVISEMPPTLEAATQTQSCANRAKCQILFAFCRGGVFTRLQSRLKDTKSRKLAELPK